MRKHNSVTTLKRLLCIISLLAITLETGCGGGKTTSEAQGATTDETTASTEAGSTADGAEAPDLNQDTKGTTITFWHSMGGVNGEAMDYLVNKFNEENTDGILWAFCRGE